LKPFAVTVQVLEDFDGLAGEDWLKAVARRAMAAGSAEPGAGVGVVIAGDQVVRDLNKAHRGLDEDTDVLAFSFVHEGEYHGEEQRRPDPAGDAGFVLPPEETDTLGEVIISYPQARRQAAEAGHGLDRELTVLLAHGVLHLLGHDHLEPGEAAAMKGLERQVIEMVWESDRPG
jgi:probable rRNA maturation factor